MGRHRWDPAQWASWKPFGIGEQRPNNYLEILKAARENAGELGYAWRILTRGVCDGCALGTSGLHDWTIDGVHLCNIRLRLLKLNTMAALAAGTLDDVSALADRPSKELRDLGRLDHPMVRRNGDPGFRRVGWDEALDLVAGAIRATSPDRLGVYLTSRGMPNEGYYGVSRAVRAMGTNSIDNSARVCHAPSTVALKAALGVGATTCSYADWLAADLIVFIGSNVANNQPVATKYLYLAKKAGAQVVVVNPYREPGMARYWIPSTLESALFGTRLTDRFFLIDTGGDVGFLTGALKFLVADGRVDEGFVAGHTTGFEAVRASAEQAAWADLEAASGTTRDEMSAFGSLVGRASRAVFVWSMGVTQHVCGEANVAAILNLALSRGFVGRTGCGVMPIRGHSGVQGGAEMGAYATAFPGGLPITAEHAGRLAQQWGFPVPEAPGLTAPAMLDAALAGDLDVLVSVGGNFLEVLPDPPRVRRALEQVPLRVHMDIVLSSQMLARPASPGGTVLLLPAATRYETPGGVTETTTERRVVFSPEIPGRRIGEARPEWSVFYDLARRVRPEAAACFDDAGGTAALRAEIARVVPAYDGIQHLARAGDQFQYGGPHLCAGWHFPTADGRAHFLPAPLPRAVPVPEGAFLATTRRGKQFNSMVHEQRDALTGAGREAVLISAEDAGRLGLAEGDAVELANHVGRFAGRVVVAPIKPGNLQVHWPEGNVLIDPDRRSPEAGIPDYNAVVSLARAPSGRIRSGQA